MKNRKSFTLVELLIVIAVIATLVAITAPQITGVIDRAQDASVISALSRVQSESALLQLAGRNLSLFEQNPVFVDTNTLVNETIGVGALTLNHDSNRRFCSFVTLLDGRTWCTDSTGFAGVVSRVGTPPQYYCTRTVGAIAGTYRCEHVAIVAPPALTGITVTPNPANVVTGGTVTFTATPVPAGAPMPGLTWSVAAGGGTITAAGVYTAPATTGSATVRATSGTIFGDSAVTINPPALTGITVTPNPSTVTVNTTQTFTATPVPAGAPMPGLTWSVAAGGGTITAAGVYTAPATTGSATVRATSGTIFGDSAVTINPPALTGITVTPNPVTVETGGIVTFTATPVPAGAPMPGLTWSVAAGGGTITAAGVYTAPATTGSATVRATSGTIFGNSAVTITSPAYFLWDSLTSHAALNMSRAAADSICAGDADRPAVCGANRWAFMSFSDTDEVRDMPTTRGINTAAPWYFRDGAHLGTRAANNWAGLMDGVADAAPDAGGFDATWGTYWTLSGLAGELSFGLDCDPGPPITCEYIGSMGQRALNFAWLSSQSTQMVGTRELLCACSR